jgi:hypothetical protein
MLQGCVAGSAQVIASQSSTTSVEYTANIVTRVGNLQLDLGNLHG